MNKTVVVLLYPSVVHKSPVKMGLPSKKTPMEMKGSRLSVSLKGAAWPFRMVRQARASDQFSNLDDMVLYDFSLT